MTLDKKNLMTKNLSDLMNILRKLDIPGRSRLCLANKCNFIDLILNAKNKQILEEQSDEDVEDCDVRAGCPKGYTRYELVNIAKSCGVKVNRRSPKTGQKTMNELCYDLSGGKIKPSPKKVNRRLSQKLQRKKLENEKKERELRGCYLPKNCMSLKKDDIAEIAKKCKLSILKSNKSGKLIKKQKKELCDNINDTIKRLSKTSSANSQATQKMSQSQIRQAISKMEKGESESEDIINLSDDEIIREGSSSSTLPLTSLPSSFESISSQFSYPSSQSSFSSVQTRKKIICNQEDYNEKYGTIADIPKNKFIQLSNGYCSDIDTILEKYMANEIKLKEDDLKRIILSTSLEPRLRALYNKFARKKEVETLINKTGFHPESINVINMMPKIGFILLSGLQVQNYIIKRELDTIKYSLDAKPFEKYTNMLQKINENNSYNIGIKILNMFMRIYNKSEKYLNIKLPANIIKGDNIYTFKAITSSIPLKNNKIEKDMLNYTVDYKVLEYKNGFRETAQMLRPRGQLLNSHVKLLTEFSIEKRQKIYSEMSKMFLEFF
jgi:hypothetical protein